MLQLVRVLLAKHNFEAAETMIRQALHEYENVLGRENLRVLVCQGFIADVLAGQGKYEPAAKIFPHVLEVREKRLGPKHLDTISSGHDLGWMMHLLFIRELVQVWKKCLDQRIQSHCSSLTGLPECFIE